MDEEGNMAFQDFKHTIGSTLNTRIRPSLWALRVRRDTSVLSAALGVRYAVGSTAQHLKATMKWLCDAQDGTADDGVSAFYDVRAGAWCPSYPETTGYIIPTFFDYAAFSKDETYRARAIRMANWLLTLQLDNGAFPIGPLWPNWERKPIVFDVGQIIFGLVRTFEETGRSEYLIAAERAGNWLAEIQETDGSWCKFTSQDYVHTYNVRVAWAILTLNQVSSDEKRREAAIKNLNWTLTQQQDCGWFENAGFSPHEDPLTHTIAYTIRGLLESGQLLANQTFIQAAQMAADALIDKQAQDGFLRARYGRRWESHLKWSCLTGTAQMAVIWFKLYQSTGDDRYKQAALAANYYLKQTQQRKAKVGIAGGIAGSFPLYGDYEPYRYLNWAAKFFVDSLLLETLLTSSPP